MAEKIGGLRKNEPELSKCVINLSWINAARNKNARFVWPENNMANIRSWVETNKQPGAGARGDTRIRVWFLSTFCTPDQIKESQTVASKMGFELEDLASTFEFFSNYHSKVYNYDFEQLREIFNDPIVPVYWKAEMARYIIVCWYAHNTNAELICYSDMDLEPTDIRCVLRHNPYLLHRVRAFGALFCSSTETSSGLENGFLMVASRVPSMIESIMIALLFLGIQSMNVCRRLAKNEKDALKRLVDKYSLVEWGFRSTPLLFHIDLIIRLDNLNVLHGNVLGFEKDTLGLVTEPALFSLPEFVKKIRELPILSLEKLAFYTQPNSALLSHREHFMDELAFKKGVNPSAYAHFSELNDNWFFNTYGKTKSEFKKKFYLLARDYTDCDSINTSCSESTFKMSEEQQHKMEYLMKGVGHAREVCDELLRLKQQGHRFDGAKLKQIIDSMDSFI